MQQLPPTRQLVSIARDGISWELEMSGATNTGVAAATAIGMLWLLIAKLHRTAPLAWNVYEFRCLPIRTNSYQASAEQGLVGGLYEVGINIKARAALQQQSVANSAQSLPSLGSLAP